MLVNWEQTNVKPIQKLDVPGEALVQGREIGFRDGSHWRDNYIILDARWDAKRMCCSRGSKATETRSKRAGKSRVLSRELTSSKAGTQEYYSKERVWLEVNNDCLSGFSPRR